MKKGGICKEKFRENFSAYFYKIMEVLGKFEIFLKKFFKNYLCDILKFLQIFLRFFKNWNFRNFLKNIFKNF